MLGQVGQLRQVAAPGNGREYWMTFQTTVETVRTGRHETVVIGKFRAEGLAVGGVSNLPQIQEE